MNRLQKAPLALVLSAMCSLPTFAADGDNGPLFMKDLVEGEEFFAPWGVGVDFFTMDQPYKIKSLQFELPGVSLPDPSLLDIDNDIQHFDLKLDAWLTPFLNVFGLIGYVDADTVVDFSQAPITGLPIPLTALPISYDGTVYGGGFTLIYGTENWFAAATTTYTDADLGGDFDSSVTTFTVQPRIGLIRDKWQIWGGGMYLDTEEDHSGTISLPIPGVPPVPFNVELEGAEKWNYAVGIGHTFSPNAHLSFEYGFGDRDHTLFNFTLRF
ncbi:MAG TPA: hypothetical protein VJ984_12490 [Xanthomonadales bacterium]|nr:hypothetical protein [Xanthomonadales bacterium]